MSHYPRTAGYKEQRGTSEAAAVSVEQRKAPRLRAVVLFVLKTNLACWLSGSSEFTDGMTADEIATELNESILSIRPRVAELRKLGLIEPTGERRPSSTGAMSAVWRLKR